MILLDTDICIEILRGNKEIIARREAVEEETAISFMTAAELFYGAEKSAHPEENANLVNDFLLGIAVIGPDLAVLHRFGILKAYLKKQGLPLLDADIFIAAVCFEKCDRIVTGNEVHFRRFKGLKIENWLSERKRS